MSEHLLNVYDRAAQGRADAFEVLKTWNEWAHAVDDIIDEKITDPERIVAAHIAMFNLTRLPFYRQHASELDGVIFAVINLWLDTVRFEQSTEMWQRAWADAARSCGNELVVAVARLVGGWDHSRAISGALRELSWKDQH